MIISYFPTARLFVTALLVPAALMLSACQPAGPRPDTSVISPDKPTPEQLWQQRQIKLREISGWETRGRIGIVTPDEGWHASLDWDQQEDAYQIQINGPTGQGIAALYGNQDGITLIVPDKGVVSAQDPEQLLEQQLGFRLPVSGLRYWAIGLPSPSLDKTEILDEQGRLKELKQDQWHILMRNYAAIDDVDIPTKLRLEHDDMSVKLVLRNWSLEFGPEREINPINESEQ